MTSGTFAAALHGAGAARIPDLQGSNLSGQIVAVAVYLRREVAL